MKNILVTGSSGFLGRSVMRKLESLEANVVGLGGRGDWDLRKQKHVEYVLQDHQPDVVIHLAAACGGIGINQEQPGKFMHDNLCMGMNLIEGCRKYNKLEKFVMIGSVCSYPKFTEVPFKESDLWKGYPEETNAPYGIAKKALMELLYAYYKQYGMQSTTLIPTNMYGPNDNFDPFSSHVIPAIINKVQHALDKGSDVISLWGTGTASREFLYVDDCAEFIARACYNKSNPEPINIGTGKEITIADLAHKITSIMGWDGIILWDDNKPDGQPRRCLDTTRSKEVFGLDAETSLELGLLKTIRWFRNQRDVK